MLLTPIREYEISKNRLYLTAKADRKRKYYAMYGKIYRTDILEEAWAKIVQSKEAKWIQVKKGGGSQRNDGNQGTCLYVWLNAEGRRISESRVRENRMHGLMRGRWISHCSTLSRVDR